MGIADDHDKKWRFVYQQLEEMDERVRRNMLAMRREQRDRLFIELISSHPMAEVMTAVSPDQTKEIMDACFAAWEKEQEKRSTHL